MAKKKTEKKDDFTVQMDKTYQIRLKESLPDREFLVLVDDEDDEFRATVELDNWNYCPHILVDKYKEDERFEFKILGDNTAIKKKLAEEFSYPQNRQVRENMAAAQYKRSYKREA